MPSAGTKLPKQHATKPPASMPASHPTSMPPSRQPACTHQSRCWARWTAPSSWPAPPAAPCLQQGAAAHVCLHATPACCNASALCSALPACGCLQVCPVPSWQAWQPPKGAKRAYHPPSGPAKCNTLSMPAAHASPRTHEQTQQRTVRHLVQLMSCIAFCCVCSCQTPVRGQLHSEIM